MRFEVRQRIYFNVLLQFWWGISSQSAAPTYTITSEVIFPFFFLSSRFPGPSGDQLCHPFGAVNSTAVDLSQPLHTVPAWVYSQWIQSVSSGYAAMIESENCIICCNFQRLQAHEHMFWATFPDNVVERLVWVLCFPIEALCEELRLSKLPIGCR